MKFSQKLSKTYGLRNRFIYTIVYSAIICIGLFCGLFYLTDSLIFNHFINPNIQLKYIKRQGKNLQSFVNKNNISSKDLSLLKKWEYRQPIILLELYDDNDCIYSSFYSAKNSINNDIVELSNNNIVEIQLSDIKVIAFLYSDYSFIYYVAGIGLSAIISLTLFIILFLRSNRRLIEYICRLNNELQILEGGNLDYQITVKGNDEIRDLAKNIDNMRLSFQQQLKAEQDLYKANKQLITEMSHDLRTPLTTILLYLEILKTKKYKNDNELFNYINKIDQKSNQLKLLTDHLFEYALHSSTCTASIDTDKPDDLYNFTDAESSCKAIINSFIEELLVNNYKVHSEVSYPDSMIFINKEFVQRVFNNILSNITKYADKNEEIRIDSIDNDNYWGLIILNTYVDNNNFVDKTETHGIGLKSIKSMINQMQGKCTIERTDSFFEITILYKKQI